MAAGPHVLVLGGSSEGFAAAERFSTLGCDVTTSFAGRTGARRQPVGHARVGGFGGAEGLSEYLKTERVALVVDATHPFAARMKANAAAACAATRTPLIHVERPAWRPQPGDDWRMAPDVTAAAALAPVTDGPCFVTVGRQEIAPFAARRDLTLLLRVIDPPDAPFDHPAATFLCDRGPFALEAERRLFADRGIGSVVSKNSGGAAAEAKLVVARELGLPVVMVERPPRPEGLTAGSVDEAARLAAEMLGLPTS
ncbi:precorrin-6A/cobalt-precorrin-6A reductase [Methylopila capsulata]|uniref:Precorrin-6A reductase n=1 Tax=Methylopila capsulata TaxID=61654 RepID=A0A9W6IZ51_9HYPH|nr:cobalt-precorrin-6A reductase [Methylopila capsulata]MBM7853017.1 precorrin-6A/cobalt-precorrin-6A reductase [Methylopila capsulata]GLK57771.1 precorrin-6A reductase [Methylopila capsulata]